jgi:predicted RNA binding protein YcfA (HicA-like mRNA interferase family)
MEQRGIMNFKQILKILMDDGWYIVTQRGSHIQLKHFAKPGNDIPPGTLASIKRQAGLK